MKLPKWIVRQAEHTCPSWSRTLPVLLASLVFLLATARPASAQTYSYWQATTSLVGSTSGSAQGDNGTYITPNTGAASTAITASSSCYNKDTTAAANISTSSAKYRITFTWVPKNGNALQDPAPAKVAIYYMRTVHADASAYAYTYFIDQNSTPPPTHGPTSATGHGNATASCSGPEGSLNISATADAKSAQGVPPSDSHTDSHDATDTKWLYRVADVQNGQAVFDFDYTLQASGNSAFNCLPMSRGSGGAGDASFTIQYAIAQTDMGRHNGCSAP